MKWTFICSATAAAVATGAAMAQDCATAPAALIGANAFDTTGSNGINLAMPAGSGCAAAHTIYNTTYFSFTPAESGSHTLSLCGGSTWDTRMAVLNDCDPNLGVVACNDDSCGLQSQVIANLAAGVTYKVVIGGFGATNLGAGVLNVTFNGGGGGGGGGGCDTPTALTLGDNLFTNSPSAEILDLTGLCTMQFTQQIYNTNYYSFTPTDSGSYRFSTCNTVDFDTKIAILNSCDPFAGVLACNDDGAGCAGFSSLIGAVDLAGGVTYIVAVGGYSATTPVGGGTLAVTLNGGGGGGCKAATAFLEGQNSFDTTGLTDLVDLTGFCDPGPFGDDIIWNAAYFTFTPTTDGAYTVSTCNLAPFDTRLAVMNTCAPADGVLACNDDGPAACANFSSRIDAVELLAGITYYVIVGGYSAADAGAGICEIVPFVPCDLPAATTAESELCGSDLNGGCNNAAGGNPADPIAIGDIVAGEFWADAGTRDTDWYLLTLTEGTEVTLTINSSIDCFAAFVGTACGGIIGAPTAGTCPGTTSACLAAGSYYVVALPSVFEGFPCGGPVGNAYTLSVSGVACDATPPVNDLCANATVAVEGANPFDNTFASTDIATPTCGFGGTPFTNDVWFTFTASLTGDYQLSTCQGLTPFDTGIEVYDACPEVGGILLGCNDDGANCAAFASEFFFTMVEGTTYTIRIGGWGGAVGATDFTITYIGDAPSCGDPGTGDCCTANGTPFCEDIDCCSLICAADAFCCDTQWDQVCANAAITGCTNCQVAPPPNDECAAAIEIPVGSTPFSTLGATGSTLACLKFGNELVFNDLWYVHTATGNETITISLCGSLFDTKMAVFEGACGGALVACNDDAVAPAACAGTLQSEVSFIATCGTSYYISVGAFSATGFGDGTITITQAGTCGTPCPTDLNGDGVTGPADLTILLNGWGGSSPDFNGDGVVGPADLTIMLNAWGACP